MAAPAATRIDLLLLGLLLDRPMHGYELYQQIKAEEIDEWFNVSMAGVYYSLGKLRDQGWVVEARQRGGRRSRKSIYHLTEEGRNAFFAAMEDQALDKGRTYLDYDLVIYFLNKIPFGQATVLLEERHAFLSREAMKLGEAVSTEPVSSGSPLTLAILDHRRRYLEMEQAWLGDVISGIQGGKEGTAGADRKGDLMVLHGDLRSYHLPDLLRLIVSGRHSGTLTLTDGVKVRTLAFEEGQPVCATAERRDEAPDVTQSPSQVFEALCDLFRWQEGQFAFDQKMERKSYCVPLDMTARDLILCGCRWVDNWDIIQRLIPSGDTIFELGPGAQSMDGMELTPVEAQVAATVDGVKDLSTLARELGLTVFEASRACYCLLAVGVLRTADLDKIRLRRVFREIAELMCSSTEVWRTGPEDRTCEEAVNAETQDLPLCLNDGRIEDRTKPQLRTEELVEMYRSFLVKQLSVVGQRFGRAETRESYQRTLRRLAPDLQEVAARYGFDRLLNERPSAG
jgi:DNA-binding PadR family transcriptional regulator